MSPAEKAALLRRMKPAPCCGDPACREEASAVALEAGAAAIEAAEALKEPLRLILLHRITRDTNEAGMRNWRFLTETEMDAARRLLAAIGGES